MPGDQPDQPGQQPDQLHHGDDPGRSLINQPVVLPGEIMRVFILKEGKEYNQGVAYLDDGTMVVVDNAKKMISKTIDISVTSVLQTTAGKMIFGKYDERRAMVEAVHQ